MGPLVSSRQRDRVEGYTIAHEEIFGPVLSVIPYTDETEALAIANHSDYGLGVSIWTADPERGARFARGVASGTVGVNGMPTIPLPRSAESSAAASAANSDPRAWRATSSSRASTSICGESWGGRGYLSMAIPFPRTHIRRREPR